MLAASLILFNKSVKISRRKYIRKRKKGKEWVWLDSGNITAPMDLVMRLECWHFDVPWSERGHSLNPLGWGPTEQKAPWVILSQISIETPRSLPRKGILHVGHKTGARSTCWGRVLEGVRGCFGFLGGLNPPLLVLPAPWPHFCTHTGACVATMDLNTKTGTRKMLPYLGISHLNGYWCLSLGSPLNPHCPCSFSWVLG